MRFIYTFLGFLCIIVSLAAQAIFLLPNLLCQDASCSQTDSMQAGKSNLYGFGPEQLGDLTNTNFTISIWLKNGIFDGNNNFIMSLQCSTNLVLSTNYQNIFVNSAGLVLGVPSNTWFNMLVQSKVVGAVYTTSVYWFVIGGASYIINPTPLVITNTFRVEFLQDSTNLIQGYTSTACCVALHKNNVKVGSENYVWQGIQNIEQPFTVLHLNFLEKEQSKITKDWSDNQYIPKLGNQFVIQTDLDDPILDTTTSSMVFSTGKYIKIEKFSLPNTFTIELKFKNDINTNSVTLLRLMKGSSIILKITFNPTPQTITLNWLTQTITYSVTASPIIYFTWGFIDIKKTDKMSLLAFQLLTTTQALTEFPQYIINPYTSNNKYQQTLYIGDPNNILVQGTFSIGEIKISQGFNYILKSSAFPNCIYYLIDRCIKCNTSYTLNIDGTCLAQCNTNLQMIYEPSHLYCVSQCHTTCLTCEVNKPTNCISCAGNRINPPKCRCPQLYFDDGISPTCIKYIQDNSVQSGQFKYTCITDGWESLSTSFFTPYLLIPKVIISLLGIQQPQQAEYQGYVDSTTINGFITKMNCRIGTIVSYKWISEQGLNVKSIIQKQLMNPTPSQEIQYTTTVNEFQTIPNVLGLKIAAEILTEFSVFHKIINTQYQGLYATSPLEVFTYQDLQISNWQTPTIFNSTLSQNSQQNNQKTCGTQYTISINQPSQVEYILLFSGITQSQGKFNFMQQEQSRSINSIVIQLLSGTMQVSKINLQVIFSSIECNNNIGMCNYYDSIQLQCNTNYFCNCESIGYYSDIDGYCQACDSSCYQCILTPTKCTACIPLYQQTVINDKCVCLANQYIDINGVCQPCSQFCQTCLSSTECTSCSIETNRILSISYCDCKPGYFEVNEICFPCDPNCVTCYLFSDNCLTCNINQIQINGSCQDCHSQCLGCTGNQDYCINCKDSAKLLINGVCTCLTHQYEDTNHNCIICDAKCLTCADTFDNCITCAGQQRKIGNCICIDGYYDNGSLDCQICDAKCLTCADTFDNCITCAGQQRKIGNCICKDGYYDNGSLDCQICDISCLTCVDRFDNCLTCAGLYRKIGNCICNDGYYDNGSLDCQICDAKCLTCVNSLDNCLTCAGQYRITKNCTCIEGYYDNGATDCYICDVNCQSCLQYSSNCTSCKAQQNKTLINGICKCHVNEFINSENTCQSNLCLQLVCDSQCSSCTKSQDFCLSCQDPFKIANENGGCDCQNGYILDQQNICQLCDVNCKTCKTSPTTCLTCHPTKYLDNSKCFKCDSSCINCTGPELTDCIDCSVNRILIQGICACKESFYENDEFEQCHYSCKNCTNSETCSQCSLSSFRTELKKGNSFCTCMNGYYDMLNQQQCLKCNDYCLTCNSTVCLSCHEEQFRKLKSGECICESPKYYDDGSLQCQSCNTVKGREQEQCKFIGCSDGIIQLGEDCDDGNNNARDGCTNCKIDENYQCVNFQQKPSFCYKCQQKCVACTNNIEQIICRECEDGYYLVDNNCKVCSDNCLTCNTMSFCTKCKLVDVIPTKEGKCENCQDKPGLYNQGGKCQSKCGDQIVAADEECDDGNLMNGDGCDQLCRVEQTHQCQGNICQQIPQPVINVYFANSTTTTGLVVHFESGEVDLKSVQVNTQIEEFTQQDFEYSFTQTTNQDDPNKFNFNLKFLKTITENNLIHIAISFSQIDTPNRVLQVVREIVVKPRKQIYYSKKQQAQAVMAKDSQDYLKYVLYFLGPSAVVLGGFQFYWALLDIMSWINSLYYINVYFSQNVLLFFENSAWGNISLVPEFLQFNPTDQVSCAESPQRFVDKGMNPIFMNNAWMCLAIWVGTILVYFASIIFIILIDALYKKSKTASNIKYSIYQIDGVEVVSMKNRQTINKPSLISKLYDKCTIYRKDIKSTMISSLNLSFLDLVTAIVLQLDICKKDGDIVMVINFSLSFVGVSICSFILWQAYKVTFKHKVLLTNKVFQTTYGCLYENINTDSRSAMLYSFINFLRKALFIICEVVFYYQPILQTLTCTIVSFLNIALMAYGNPFIDRQQLIKNGVPDLCIFVIMIICVGLALDDQIGKLNGDQRFQIGWVILGTIGISISVQMYFLLSELITNIIENLKALRAKLCQ